MPFVSLFVFNVIKLCYLGVQIPFGTAVQYTLVRVLLGIQFNLFVSFLLAVQEAPSSKAGAL